MFQIQIPHIPLEDGERETCLRIMREGNSLMKSWAFKHFGKANCVCKLRRSLFKWANDNQDPDGINPHDIGISQRDMASMLMVRDIESTVMFGFARLVKSVVGNHHWMLRLTFLEFDDLMLEGFMALQDAVYSYSKTDADFMTYAHCCIQRRIRKAVRKTSKLGGFTKYGMELLSLYRAQRRKLEERHGLSFSFDAIASTMDLSTQDMRRLRVMVKSLVKSCDMVGLNEDSTYENGAMTSVEDQDQLDVMIVRSALNKVSLNEMESELVLSTMSGSRNVSEIASRYTNPGTGNPYTRMAAIYMQRRVLQRVRLAIEGKDCEVKRKSKYGVPLRIVA